MQADYDVKLFGAELRRCRIALGMTGKQLVLLYSEAIGREDNPVDVSFIFRLEAGKDMLVDKGRRLILARLVDMPLTAAGLGLLASEPAMRPFRWEPVDTKEYASALESYCDTWQQGTTYKAVRDIRKRIYSLERSVLYTWNAEKKQMTKLLCGYQMIAADVAAEQSPGAANQILTHTIALSSETKLHNTYAHALRQRAGASIDTFEQTGDYRVLPLALEDFQAAEEIQPHVSSFYQALVDVRRGLAYAYVARDEGEFTKALKIIDDSSNQIGKQSDDRHIAARLDEERYRLNRASAYLFSPQGSPRLALSELDQAIEAKPNTAPRRGVHRDLLFAETYIALKNYPMAVACASAAVEVSASNGMDTLFNRLEKVYRDLRNSDYGNDPDVARLGVQISKAQYPELFA